MLGKRTCDQVIYSMKMILEGFIVEDVTFAAETLALPIDKHSLIFDWTADSATKGTLVALAPANDPSLSHLSEPLSALAIYFDQEFVDEVLDVEGFTFTRQSDINDPFLFEIATKLRALCTEGVFAENIYGESLGVACIEHLAKTYRGSKDPYYPKGKLNPYQLKQVVDFAHSYMQFNIGLHETAGLVHLSPYHFGRLFKQTVGKSPYQFILQLKIECAKKMIKQNNGPISEIAYQLNFSDQSHFSNAFRKATGISPRQFLYS